MLASYLHVCSCLNFIPRTILLLVLFISYYISFKVRIFRVASEKWIETLNKPVMKNSESGGKLKLYKLFKAEPTPASYVLSPLDPGPRWVMASLRAGCLPLGVETRRYRIPGVPLERRVCQVCNSDLVKDEFHFCYGM